MIVYPEIDPVALSLGPLKVRWYGLMYVVGIGLGWWLARRRAAGQGSTWKPVDVDDLIFFAAIGVKFPMLKMNIVFVVVFAGIFRSPDCSVAAALSTPFGVTHAYSTSNATYLSATSTPFVIR